MGSCQDRIACFVQYQWWLVASYCIGIVLLLELTWVLLVRLGGTRGRDWGALLFTAYLFSHLPLFSWARDIFLVFLLPSFLLCDCLIVSGVQEFWAMGLTLVFGILSFPSFHMI